MHDLAAEVALGIADGEERAEALRHLSTCGDCRRLVEQLSQVADELLLLAPVHEPPAGFEARVVAALGRQAPPRRRRASWLAPRGLARQLAPPLVAAALSCAVLIAVYHDDHLTAERYRDTLAQANGQYFQAEPVRDKTGAKVGVVFGYQGSPSWMLVTVDPAHRDVVTSAELVSRDGRTIPLASLQLDPREGSWGGAIPVKLYQVASIRLLGERPGQVLEASFPVPSAHGG